MMKDLTAISRIDRMRDEIKELATKKFKLQEKLRSLGLTATQVRNRSSTVSEEIWEYRDGIVKEMKEVESLISPLKEKFRDVHFEFDENRNKKIRQIFDEIFSEQQRAEIYKEIDRRICGEHPIPTGYNFKDLERYKEGYYKFRDLSRENIDNMINFRVMLTGMIEEGCNKFGKAEFLKFISPLNTMILPVIELKRIKSKHLL